MKVREREEGKEGKREGGRKERGKEGRRGREGESGKKKRVYVRLQKQLIQILPLHSFSPKSVVSESRRRKTKNVVRE